MNTINGTLPTRERLEEAAREVGVLLFAFAPLDAALNETREFRGRVMLLFLALGVAFFVGALVAEHRRKRHG